MSRAHMLRTSAFILLGGATATQLPRRTAWAESPDNLPTKKPIYSGPVHANTTPKPRTITDPLTNSPPNHTPTPTDRLTKQIARARVFLYHQSLTAENAVNDAIAWAFKQETSFTSTLASLAPSAESGEQLLPGAIYVLVATMAGSIVSRNRNILIRATFPAAIGITAGWMLIPVTMRNTGDLIWEYEKKVPAISETHLQIRGFVQEAWRQTKVHSEAVTKWADETAGDSRKKVEKWVGEGR